MKKKIISLNGSWTLTAKALELHINADVPGTIYGALLNEKIIPDPFYRDNEDVVKPYMNHDYQYETDFHIEDEDLLTGKLNLVFNGLDTLADVYLNQALILKASNMHTRYCVDITKVAQFGKNSLTVMIYSPLQFMHQEEDNYPHALFQVSDAMKGYIHLRKAHYMFGWDWGPQLPDGGIWRDVYLESVPQAKINDLIIEQQHHQSKVNLTIKPEIESIDVFDGKIKVALFDPDNQLIHQSFHTRDERISIDIAQAKKWYPTGYGEQNLYTINCELIYQEEMIDICEKTIGLREVKLIQEEDQWGESFTIEVNGLKVFAKGANYIPEDNLLSRTNEALTYDLLKSAKAANHNMVRVWGGGIYPPAYFYEICDRLGLMVWQDVMFACSIYPMDKESFVTSIREELIDNLKRIRNHPSLVLICGNNENETAIEHWDVPSIKRSKEFYIKQYMEIIPEIVETYAPSLPYWRSSPSSKELFKDTNSDAYGDMHYWGVWHNNEPFTNYRNYYPRFMSEFGIQSFPGVETIDTFTIEEDKNIFSYVMEKHQKNKTANSKILNYIGKHFKYPKDFESLLYISQAIQAEGVRYGVEHWRRNYGRCMGILYWQLNDCWPVASWSSIDYFHRWKMLHYHSKKFYAPILISIEEKAQNAKIVITNDTLEDIRGQVNVQLLTIKGDILKTVICQVGLIAQSKKVILDLNLDYQLKEKMQTYIYADFQVEGNIVSENTAFLVPDKHLALVKPQITYELTQSENSYRIKLQSKYLAKFVEIKVIDEDIIFSDNYFNLIPNKEKIITFVSDKQVTKAHIRIKSLIDTF